MPRLRRLLKRVTPGRRLVAAELAVLHLIACGGLPAPTSGKPTDVPFPCAGRGCGCATADACWAGACCCFTAREKMTWAVEHDFTPPDHFLRAVEREIQDAADAAECPHCAAKKSCCPAPPARSTPSPWLVGVFALKCKGAGFGGLLTLPPAVPAPVVVVVAESPAAFDLSAPVIPVSRPAIPPVPPPRVG